MTSPPATDRETALWLALNVESVGLSDDQFLRVCRDNEDFRFEVSARGELIIMAPAFPPTDEKNVLITTALRNWVTREGGGRCFGPSAMFTLPNGAKRSPDASWLSDSRWDRLTESERRGFTKVCPDFVVELRSSSDRLSKLKQKMEEYLANGAHLGWLIDPVEGRAYIYRPDQPPDEIRGPAILNADPVLPGFGVDLREIFD